MSKKARAIKHIKKMAEKRRKKAAKVALWSSRAGTSLKAKKIAARQHRSRRFNYAKHAHLMAHCGNPACRKCGG